jgi:hypothetical protein
MGRKTKAEQRNAAEISDLPPEIQIVQRKYANNQPISKEEKASWQAYWKEKAGIKTAKVGTIKLEKEAKNKANIPKLTVGKDSNNDGVELYFGDMPVGQAVLESNGHLCLYIDVKNVAGVKGGQVFNELLSYPAFQGKITAIKGDWNKSEAIGDNFEAYQANIAKGLSEIEAARNTFTGAMSGKNGYGNIKVLNLDPPNPDRIIILFAK